MGIFFKTLLSVDIRPRNYVLGAGKSCRAFFRPILHWRRPFPRGELGKSRFWGIRPLWEGPAARGKRRFTPFQVEILERMEFLRVGYSQLFFCPKFSFLAPRGVNFT